MAFAGTARDDYDILLNYTQPNLNNPY